MRTDPAALIETAARLVGYANANRYHVRGDSLFNGIPLRGKQVLEVGSGAGAWAIWAGLHGANRVVGIEPEARGSTPRSLKRFEDNVRSLGLARTVLASGDKLEQVLDGDESFDIVVMFNVINHLDEEAVKVLRTDRGAREQYTALLRKLRGHTTLSGWLIVADCARTNFWNQLGLGSPFARTIEWEKHQNPRVWMDVMERAGFRDFDLRWSPLQPFPKLTQNSLVQYFTCSHFVLRCRAGEKLSNRPQAREKFASSALRGFASI